MIGLIAKVFVLSVALSIAIKAGAPALSLASTATNALIAVWLPAAIVTALLGWRWQQAREKQKAKGEE